MIPYPAFTRTSAKSGNIAKKPRRVRLICPVCGGRFSLNYAEYRKHLKKGLRPCDSMKCGWEYRKRREAAAGAICGAPGAVREAVA